MITIDSEKILTLGNEEDDRMSVFDKDCIEKNEGYQLSDLKYCTFDDITMDDQLKSDISYEILINDFKSTRDILIHYRTIYSNLLVQNPHNIIYSFKKYKLNFINFNINAFLLLRQLDLMSYVLKLKFEHSDDINLDSENIFQSQSEITNEFLEIIKKEYNNKGIDDLILQWTGDENLKKIIFEEVEDMVEIRETFYKGIEYEKFILSFVDKNKNSPSICGIGVLLKYLKMILERSVYNIEILSNTITEEIMLDFFQDCCKVEIIFMMAHNTFRVPQNDIFNLKESSQEWKKLKRSYERIVSRS
jgi:hypothetical protein